MAPSHPAPPLLKRPRKPWTLLRRLLSRRNVTPDLYTTDLSLEDLVGEHTLTGFSVEGGASLEPTRVLFTLDGRTYVAVQDQSDGYRSMLDHLRLSPVAAPRVGPRLGVKVVATMGSGTSQRILRLNHARTGVPILEVGTYDGDSYYPSFHYEWHPEGLKGRLGPISQTPHS